jgi:hypothetical protein
MIICFGIRVPFGQIHLCGSLGHLIHLSWDGSVVHLCMIYPWIIEKPKNFPSLVGIGWAYVDSTKYTGAVLVA